tara:strand:- start:282 stop:563 length:282 start_codon:yes stop_codon:yes gene_type:complete
MSGQVGTHTELLIITGEQSLSYRINIDITLLPSTDEGFVGRYPNGFHMFKDFDTLEQAIEYHKILNRKLNLPDPVGTDNMISNMSDVTREDLR